MNLFTFSENFDEKGRKLVISCDEIGKKYKIM